LMSPDLRPWPLCLSSPPCVLTGRVGGSVPVGDSSIHYTIRRGPCKVGEEEGRIQRGLRGDLRSYLYRLVDLRTDLVSPVPDVPPLPGGPPGVVCPGLAGVRRSRLELPGAGGLAEGGGALGGQPGTNDHRPPGGLLPAGAAACGISAI